MPAGFKAPPLLFTVRGMLRCDWLSGFIAFCRERRRAFVAVWKKREKTWQNTTTNIAFCIKLKIEFSMLTRYWFSHTHTRTPHTHTHTHPHPHPHPHAHAHARTHTHTHSQNQPWKWSLSSSLLNVILVLHVFDCS